MATQRHVRISLTNSPCSPRAAPGIHHTERPGAHVVSCRVTADRFGPYGTVVPVRACANASAVMRGSRHGQGQPAFAEKVLISKSIE